MRRRIVLALIVSSLIPVIYSVVVMERLILRVMSMSFNPMISSALEDVMLLPTRIRHEREYGFHQFLLANQDALSPAEPDTSAPCERLAVYLPDDIKILACEVVHAGRGVDARDQVPPSSELLPELTSLDTIRISRMVVPLPSNPDKRLVATLEESPEISKRLKQTHEVIKLFKQFSKMQGQVRRGIVISYALLLGLVCALSFFLGFLLPRSALLRIKRLTGGAQAIGEGRLDYRLAEGPVDELGKLERAFNRMSKEIELSKDRIRYLERISAWRELARKLAHEIKNPLTPIKLVGQELVRQYQGADQRYREVLQASADIIEEEVERLKKLVQDFSTLGKVMECELKPESFLEVWREYRSLIDSYSRYARLEVICLVTEAVTTHLDRKLFRHVFSNLLDNAIHAVADQPDPHIVVACQLSLDDPRTLVITIADNGPGIAAANRMRIFEPYFTTREDGTGLGLAIVKKLVLDHSGTIEVQDHELGGVAFVITLPLVKEDLGGEDTDRR